MTSVDVSQAQPLNIDISGPHISVDVYGGQPGPQGPAGPPGSGTGGYVGFTHTQTTPASTWIINHSLGRYPASVNIVIDNELVDTDIDLPSTSQIVVTFATPQSGIAEIT